MARPTVVVRWSSESIRPDSLKVYCSCNAELTELRREKCDVLLSEHVMGCRGAEGDVEAMPWWLS